MPTPYQASPAERRRVFSPTIPESILGTKRATKTFIQDTKLVLVLSLVRNHAETLLQEMKLLTGLSELEILERFPGVRKWSGLVDHLENYQSSYQGFTTKAAVRAEALRQEEETGLNVLAPSKPTQRVESQGEGKI